MTALTLPRRILGIAAVLLVSLVVSGCAPEGLESQYRDGSNKGYIAGDGSVTEIPSDERAEAIEFGGKTEDGSTFSSVDLEGRVAVVNFWYASCAPCRAEAPQLQSLWETYSKDDVQFVGVNVYDQPDTATSFNTTYGITYPSIMDVGTGAAKLAFTGTVPPKAVPTTLVLDRQGRVASRILGQLPDESVLSTLIRETLEESAN